VMSAAASISWSASANGTSRRAASRLPMEVFPAPIMPTSATVFFKVISSRYTKGIFFSRRAFVVQSHKSARAVLHLLSMTRSTTRSGLARSTGKSAGSAHLIEAFLDMMGAERGAGAHTLAAYRRDLLDFAGHLSGKGADPASASREQLRDFLTGLSTAGL